LRGTIVFLRERVFEPFPEIWLVLSTAATARKLDAHRVEEHFLGTDFAYDDLRFRTPRYLIEATRIERRPEDGVVVLEASWRHRGRIPVVCRALVSDECGLPLEASWRSLETGNVLRELSLEGIRRIDQVWAPQTMSVARPREGYSSRMELQSLRLGVDLPTTLFDPTESRSAVRFVEDTLE
jgi:hypothetical protein